MGVICGGNAVDVIYVFFFRFLLAAVCRYCCYLETFFPERYPVQNGSVCVLVEAPLVVKKIFFFWYFVGVLAFFVLRVV